MGADTPGERRRLLVGQITEARRSGGAVRFEAGPRTVRYDDRRLRLELDSGERAALESLCEEYRVFKIEQPATRKAEAGVVYLSAVTDAKHAADFVESLFREVYGLGEGYELQAAQA